MRTSDVKPGERVKSVRFTDDALVVDLLDGRTISVPLVWYPRLLFATPAQRANWRVAGGGFGIHWPDVDEDLSTEGLLRGAPGAQRLIRNGIVRGTWPAGYTPGMKIAVSVPDDVFEEAEQLARRMKRSRSEVYSRALAEYVARHAPDRVTEAMDRALAEIGEPAGEFVRAASRHVLKRSEW